LSECTDEKEANDIKIKRAKHWEEVRHENQTRKEAFESEKSLEIDFAQKRSIVLPFPLTSNL